MDIQKELELFKTVAIAKGWSIDGETTQTNYRFYSLTTSSGWEVWQVAKAQAVQEPSINMTGHDLKYISDFMDYADPENLDTEVTIQLCKEGFEGDGLYAWVAEYPEEGGIKLGEAQEQKG